ncbi:GNAT family N-acetyltransferase, partial [Halorubrum sp. Atlit-28R]
MYGSLAGNTSTYVVREGNKIVTVFLFVRMGAKVKVFNEVVRISDRDIARFAEYVFAAYKKVMVISFHAIQADIRRLRFPYQQFNCSEDIVLTLP